MTLKVEHSFERFGDTRVRQALYRKGQTLAAPEGIFTLAEDCVVDIKQTFRKRTDGGGGFWDDDTSFTFNDLRPVNPSLPEEPVKQGFWARLFKRSPIPVAKVVKS